MNPDAFLPLAGQFYRAVLSENARAVLAAPGPQSAGRYHRQGQPALYMSSRPEWSVIAVSGYMREDGLPRVLIPLRVMGARIVDQRDKARCLQMGIIPELSTKWWQLCRPREYPCATRKYHCSRGRLPHR